MSTALVAAAILFLAAGLMPASGAQRRAPAPAAASLVLPPEAGAIVLAEVAGRPMRLRVDPGFGLTLNPAAAARAGLNGSLFGGTAIIGPRRLSGKSSLARLQIGAWSGQRRFFWFERDVVEGADGTIGMADLPYPAVTLQLRPASAGERVYQFRVTPDRVAGLTYRHRLGDRDVSVRFSPMQPITQASAAVGALLGDRHAGGWSGALREEPILLGVKRPVRPMRLGSPLLLNGFEVREVLIRTDYRGRYALPTDPPPPGAEADPNEIVVTGDRGRSRAAFRLTVGADTLSGCSSITYRKATRTLTLSCRGSR